jgi:hypothetical protein
MGIYLQLMHAGYAANRADDTLALAAENWVDSPC